MALRQLVPEFQLGFSVARELRAVPKLQAPKVVGFRGGADLGEVVAAFSSDRHILVDAAPGAGKTRVLPAALLKAGHQLVVHVFPYAHMAYVQAASMRLAGTEVVCVEDVVSPFPVVGWVTISAACLVARWLAAGEVTLPTCVLLHDESHESGCYSAVLRALGPVVAGVKCYAELTATAKPSGARVMETRGKVIDRGYDRAMYRDPWQVGEQGAPWCLDGVSGHVAVYEDDKRRAQALVSSFSAAGARAFRLHSSMTGAAVWEVLRAVTAEVLTICVLVVDSSFRSYYALPVSRSVDSGTIRYVAVSDGKPVARTRDVYEIEVVQTRARGGRFPGQVTEYLCPVAKPERKICDLQPADVEACALLMRLLGYNPMSEIAEAVMARGNVPRDVCGALRGDMPLACLSGASLTSLEALSSPAGRRSPFAAEDVPAWARATRRREPEGRTGPTEQQTAPGWDFGDGSFGVVDSNRSDAVVEQAASARSSPVGLAGPLSSVVSAEDLDGSEDLLQAMMSVKPVTSVLVVGEYYGAVGLLHSNTESSAFPAGADSVRRVMARDTSGVVHRAWSDHTRATAINALVVEANVATVELRALVSVLRQVGAGHAHKYAATLSQWAARCSERMVDLTHVISSAQSAAMVLGDKFCTYAHISNGFPDEESRVMQDLMVAFEGMPEAGSVGLQAHVSAVKQRVRQYDRVLLSDSEGLRSSRMPTIGRGSRAVHPLLNYLSGSDPRYKKGGGTSSLSSGSSRKSRK